MKEEEEIILEKAEQSTEAVCQGEESLSDASEMSDGRQEV